MDKKFDVTKSEEGERIDRWLCRKLPQLSRNQIKRTLDDGRVIINGRRVVIASWELEGGDHIELRLTGLPADEVVSESAQRSRPPRRDEGRGGRGGHEGSSKVRSSLDRHLNKRKDNRKDKPRGEDGGQKRLHLKVYHEDRDLIVVEKPASIPSVKMGAADGGNSLEDEIRKYMKRKHRGSSGSFVAPLHRLDVETTGVMVFALSKVGQGLEKQFREHSVRREYIAIVEGRIEKEQGIIDKPVEKGDFGGGRKVREAEKGKGMKAITEYRVKERYSNATLLDVTVRTGRTHQIRVHFASEGFPIMGEARYGEGHEAADMLPFKRHALHAAKLGFKHPASGKKMQFDSPLPDDMTEIVDKLRTNC